MAVTSRVLPVDRLVAVYNLGLAAVWAAAWPRAGFAVVLAAAHVAAAGLPWLLARAPDRLSRPMELLRELYPLVLVAAFWTELGLFRELRVASHDAVIRQLELTLLGGHPHVAWMARMPALWFSELMYGLYFLYYPLIYLPPLFLAVRGRTDAVRDVTLRLMVGYLGCYVFYYAFPVNGPRLDLLPFDGALTNGLFYQAVRASQDMGAALGAAFPSSHVVGACTIAILGWRWFGRGVAALLTVEAVGVVLSTVYTRQHYAVDVLAGVVWAIALQTMAVPLAQRWLAGRARVPAATLAPEPASLPLLPRPVPDVE